MTDQHFRDRGIELAERVRSQVDPRDGLDRLFGRHRRRRIGGRIAGALAVLALVVAPAIVVGRGRPATHPPAGSVTISSTTTVEPTASTSLPITVYAALLDGFVTNDTQPAHCTGTAAHVDLQVGTPVALLNESAGGGRQVVAESAIAAAGVVIDAVRAQELGLPETGSACLFELMTVFTETRNVGSLLVNREPWPSPDGFEAGMSTAGRQIVFYSRGVSP